MKAKEEEKAKPALTMLLEEAMRHGTEKEPTLKYLCETYGLNRPSLGKIRKGERLCYEATERYYMNSIALYLQRKRESYLKNAETSMVHRINKIGFEVLLEYTR